MSVFTISKLATAWCPGCGNFSIRDAVLKGLSATALSPQDVLFVSGVGQAAKAPNYMNVNCLIGLHGRSLPIAMGAKLANPRLAVIAESGDGCNYGEGGNHFIATMRRNINLTVLVHDNQVYGLTKGQPSPTSDIGMPVKTLRNGVADKPFQPLSTAMLMGAQFVARGFSGDVEHLADLVKQAVEYPGLAVIDILTPCVSYNKLNTFGWYSKRVKKIAADYDSSDYDTAFTTSKIWGDTIPLGVVYRKPPETDASKLPQHLSLIDSPPKVGIVAKLLEPKLY